MSRRSFVFYLALGTALTSIPAQAQESGGADPVELLKSACTNQQTGELSHVRLAQFILMEAGLPPLDAVMDERIPDEQKGNDNRLIWFSNELGTQAEFEGSERQIAFTIEGLEDHFARSAGKDAEPVVLLNPKLLESLPVETEGPFRGKAKNGWLFNRGLALKMRCGAKAGETPSALGAEKFEVPSRPVIAIRKKPEDFTVGGKERLTAEAFTIGYEKKWDFDETTALEDTTTWTIDGSLGLRLSQSTKGKTSSYLFTRYQLERVRADPLPELEEGQTRDAKDKNVLEVGGLVDTQILDSSLDVFLISSASYVTNFVDDNEKIRFRNLLEFGHPDMKLPICGFGFGQPLGIGDLSGRCNFRLDLEGAFQTKLGTADPSEFDDYLGAGANGTFEIFTELQKKQQVIIGVTGRYIPIIHGPAPDIWRIDVAAKNRYWINDAIGFDIGATFSDGRNVLTLEEEKKLVFGFGVIM